MNVFKREQKKPMSSTRRAILTHIEASERMRIHQEEMDERKKKIPRYIGLCIALYGIFIIAEYLGGILEIIDAYEVMFWIGLLLGALTQALLILFNIWHSEDTGFQPPTYEEMNELGDEII